jgi:hypothetical protein
LIDRPPQFVIISLERQKHLIEVLLITRPGTETLQLIGIRLAKLATALAEGLSGYDYATFKEKCFHSTAAEAEAKV